MSASKTVSKMLSKMGTERNVMGEFATLKARLGLACGPRTASFGLYYRCTTVVT